VLPIPEMQFHNWREDRPRIVGYSGKWDEQSPDYTGTVRQFIAERDEPDLHRWLTELSEAAWRLFDLRGFARVDFRVDEGGEPTILELNPNPCLEPGAGLAAAAAEAGIAYPELVERILLAAI
jgi:D-alanine-D-alanine ligase